MTVRATRTLGLTVLGAAGFWAVVDVLFVLLLRQPSLLWFIAFIVAAGTLSGFLLLRPLAFGFDGRDLVYTSGGNDKRIQRGDVARCAVTASNFVFSDEAGAQLLTVPRQRFKDADVAAVCSLAGIAVAGLVRPLDKARSDLGQAKMWVGLSIFCVAATLFLTGISFWAQVASQENLAAYRAAPVCNGSPATSGCRFETKAVVTGVEAAKSYSVLHLELADGSTMNADLPLYDATPSPQDSVDVELWKAPVAQLPGLGPWLRVTSVDGVGTEANPALDPNLDTTGPTAGFGVFLVISLCMLAFGVRQLTRARGGVRAAAEAATGVSGPVRPLRPDAPLPR